MNSKTVITIFLSAIFVLSSVTAITLRPAKAIDPGTLTLSDAELMLPEFTWEYDPGSSLTGKTDLPGPGVQFDLANLGKAGVGDNFPVNQLAGGALNSGYYSDFSGYSEYSMLFVNVGSGTISVSIYMNTGFTNQNPAYDTFWCSNWVTLAPYQSAVVTLNFSSSYQAWNCYDDPGHYHEYADGSTGLPIWRLNEVTNIGFQVLGTGSASVLVSGTLTPPDLEFNLVAAHSPPFQYGETFEVEVWVTDIYAVSPLQGYDLNVSYDPSLALFKGVNYWGVLGNGTASVASSVIEVKGQGGSWSGNGGLLFALTFQVEFVPSADTVWTKNHQSDTFQVTIVGATLSLPQGDITMSGITMPSPLTVEIDFIRGDVNCDGIVNTADLSAEAQCYGQTAPSYPPEYDLNNDGIIDIYDIVTIATNYGYGVHP